MRKQAFVWCTIVLAGCSSESFDDASPGEADSSADETVIRIRVVDADSTPLAGMMPVATEGPSLLSTVVSQGNPTSADGESQLVLSKDAWAYMRAIDPAGDRIAVEFVERQPGDSPESDDPIDLVMETSAAIVMTLPAKNDTPELLMIHPAHGEWWHAKGVVDPSGVARFTGLPSGVYALKIQSEDTTIATIREVVLTPGEVKDLGEVSPSAK